MSNIGKQPIPIPEGVEVSRKESSIIVKGKLGELTQEFNSDIQIEINDIAVIVSRNSDEKIQRECLDICCPDGLLMKVPLLKH